MKLNLSELHEAKDEIYRKLKLKVRILSEDQILDVLRQLPALIQRPIVKRDNRTFMASPSERINRLLFFWFFINNKKPSPTPSLCKKSQSFAGDVRVRDSILTIVYE